MPNNNITAHTPVFLNICPLFTELFIIAYMFLIITEILFYICYSHFSVRILGGIEVELTEQDVK